MAKVSLNINGRKYALGCDDGEEERLMRLGQKLDDRVNNMANQFGQIGDLRLLVMAGITMLDELEEMNKSVDNEVDKRIGDLLNLRFTRILKPPRTKWDRHFLFCTRFLENHFSNIGFPFYGSNDRVSADRVSARRQA